MADIIATNLAGKKVTETYKGVLHFDTALGIDAKPVYDGAGTKTALSLGAFSDKAIINGDLQVLNDLTISSDSTLIGNVNVGGDITLTNGGAVNDLVIAPSGDEVSLRTLKTTEVGKLRIRESSTDYELIFGNPTQTTSNLFSIIVKKDNTNNLYIKNNYSDPDVNAPLWINRSTGEVNIKSLIVNSFDNKGTAGTTVNTGGGLFPTGGIMMFTVSGVPAGWLECDGSDISINDYGVLYGVIGQNYTTSTLIDKTTRFQIPDMRGLFVRGWDNNKGIDAGRALGDATQGDMLKSHDHPFYWGQDPTPSAIPAIGGSTTGNSVQNYNFYGIGGDQIGNTGGTETRPKNIALIYCIKT
jgi:microcystin-dependent protein